ncbi:MULTISPECIES: outer membrane protein [Sphingobium]|uniref:Porin family protein n=1 Tax=Sphingobium limneticum TaxID=1007511 RepID=A0A5J5I0W8_9SPHN|nr:MULTISPECIES: outer membrane beta-barrel protein [Sphingobium]MBU0933692.1 outer membrane beta-barrel protein [Alphaproteobacteria bacterium]KAA9014307.1 porin family protein [Sphingobium limneticum]KAA9018599.1 porin family protein [Sphingobium limneticum]KAA9027396.1 porin family protein [Sphingobium limneticum]BBC99640.1 outer membrane immunogenic protein [Sphingobium sp. YG1]
MKLTLIAPLGATLALALAMPAAAQDSAPVDWTGPYIGGSFGYNWQKKDGGEHMRFDADADGDYDDVIRTSTGANAFSPGTCGGAARGSTPASGCKGDKNAIGWMGHVGYDRQFGNIVAGVVAEAGQAYIDDKVTEYSTTPAFYTMRRSIDYNANLRARLGYTTSGGIMPYITGGLAYAKVKNNFSTSNGANSFTEVDRKEDGWGYTMGGGIEAKVSNNFSIGARYLWTRYNVGDYRVDVGAGTAPATNPFRLTPSGGASINRGDKFDTQSVMVTTSFRF